jgi:hypothetical protein
MQAAAITIIKNSQIECSKRNKKEIKNVLAICWRLKNHNLKKETKVNTNIAFI